MKRVLVLGAGAMGSAFTVPCVDNKNDVVLVGTHLEDKVIENIDDYNRKLPSSFWQHLKDNKLIDERSKII